MIEAHKMTLQAKITRARQGNCEHDYQIPTGKSPSALAISKFCSNSIFADLGKRCVKCDKRYIPPMPTNDTGFVTFKRPLPFLI